MYGSQDVMRQVNKALKIKFLNKNNTYLIQATHSFNCGFDVSH